MNCLGCRRVFVCKLNAKRAKSVAQCGSFSFVFLFILIRTMLRVSTVGYKMWSPRNGEKAIAPV